jgi:hypothetical protein
MRVFSAPEVEEKNIVFFSTAGALHTVQHNFLGYTFT